MSIQIIQGDILKQDVDYIVNAANGHLRHGGGVARAIAEAADPWHGVSEAMVDLFEDDDAANAKLTTWREDHNRAPLIATGDAYVTSAGVLPFKGVVHAVGPIWGGGTFKEEDLLFMAHDRAYTKALIHNDSLNFSIAFPAISCGIFGFPVKNAAAIALVAASLSFWRDVDTRFVLFSDEHYAAYLDAAERLEVELS
jgi:O-acetyl-ADP-ribose deacetylase (regulator of RNase III)